MGDRPDQPAGFRSDLNMGYYIKLVQSADPTKVPIQVRNCEGQMPRRQDDDDGIAGQQRPRANQLALKRPLEPRQRDDWMNLASLQHGVTPQLEVSIAMDRSVEHGAGQIGEVEGSTAITLATASGAALSTDPFSAPGGNGSATATCLTYC